MAISQRFLLLLLCFTVTLHHTFAITEEDLNIYQQQQQQPKLNSTVFVVDDDFDSGLVVVGEIKKSSVSEEKVVVETETSFNSIPFPSIKATKRVVLVRHGQSTWNEEGRIQGSSNFSVLTQKGESQAETSRQMLVDDTFDVCFTSPLNRSKRTAEIIWGTARKESMIPDYDLREIDLYSFQVS